MVRWSADGVVAVTGAGGRLGTRLAFRLAAEGARQKLVTRNPDHIPRLDDGRPLPESMIARVEGFDDADGMRRAFDRVRTVFLVSASRQPDRVAQHTAAIDAAVAAGVERLVYVSFVGAAPDAAFAFTRDCWHTEEYLKRSGLRWTILRGNLFHHTLTTFVGPDGVIHGPAGEGRVASVSHDDVADVATAVLLDEKPARHDGTTYEVTGPEALTLHEVAQVLSEAAGRSIVYEPQTTEEAYAPREHLEAPEHAVHDRVTACEAIAAGALEHVSRDVPRLVGRPARSLAQWLDDYPVEWAHLLVHETG